MRTNCALLYTFVVRFRIAGAFPMPYRKIAYIAGIVLLMMLSAMGGAALYNLFWGNAKRYIYLNPSAHSTAYGIQEGGGSPIVLPGFEGAAELARPAVVHVKSHFATQINGKQDDFFGNPFRDFWDEEQDSEENLASGSGVLISADGYITTNNHVVEDADFIEITLFDNRRYTADVVAVDISTDLALLKIDGKDFPYLKFGKADKVRVGQWVLAVGNPLDLNSTVTAGIVSAKGRNINLLREDSDLSVESFIQTDAAVNRGNSGGALINVNGELIGINTAIASRTGYYSGYSFAIPSEIVQKVMEDLLKYGEVKRGFLGVQIQPVDAELADSRNLSVLQGAYISSVSPTGGAWAGGIREGDVILSVNDMPVTSTAELQEQVSRYRPGDQIRIGYMRGKDLRHTDVVLQGYDGSTSLAPKRLSLEYKGCAFRMLTADECKAYGVDHGAKVEKLSNAMKKGGVQPNLIVTEVNGRKIRSIDILEQALKESADFVNLKGVYGKGVSATYSFSW